MKNKREALRLFLGCLLLLPLAVAAQNNAGDPAYPRDQQDVYENESGAFRDRNREARDADRRDIQAESGTVDRPRHRVESENRTDRNEKWTGRDIRNGDPTGGSDLSPSTGDPNDPGTWGPRGYGIDEQKSYTPR